MRDAVAPARSGPPTPPAPPGPGALRASMSRFVTGVTVITFAGDDGPRGLTVNSFTSVSAHPPLVLASIAHTAKVHDQLVGRPFAVNILGAEQANLAQYFASLPNDASPRWLLDGPAPRLADPLAWMQCAPWRTYDGGDHTLMLGQVTDLGHRGGDALTYAWSRFSRAVEAPEGIEHLL